MQFEGKNAVITGGFGAMGLTITRHFFCNGFDVSHWKTDAFFTQNRSFQLKWVIYSDKC